MDILRISLLRSLPTTLQRYSREPAKAVIRYVIRPFHHRSPRLRLPAIQFKGKPASLLACPTRSVRWLDRFYFSRTALFSSGGIIQMFNSVVWLPVPKLQPVSAAQNPATALTALTNEATLRKGRIAITSCVNLPSGLGRVLSRGEKVRE